MISQRAVANMVNPGKKQIYKIEEKLKSFLKKVIVKDEEGEIGKIRKGLLKGTVSVISSDSPHKDVNARFTTVSFKALSDQV